MHATGGGFQRGVQGKRAVAVIFEAVALGAAGRKRQDWIEPIQSLNGSLLIDAENRCMLRRVQIQADDVSRLALEIRIVAWPCTAPDDAVSRRPLCRRGAQHP